ncbi:MAG: helix-turn-helix domain-containing protein [Solirubrobacterales bacterium]
MDLLPIKDSLELGAAIRGRRYELELTQEELADVARVTVRFVSELERGKESAQFAGIRRVLAALGLDLYVKPR